MLSKLIFEFLIPIIIVSFVASQQICQPRICQPFSYRFGFSEVLQRMNYSLCSCQDCDDIQNFVKFYYKTSDTSEYQEFNLNNTPRGIINSSEKVTVLIHGYLGHVDFARKDWMVRSGNREANGNKKTVILVDYDAISSCNYFYLAHRIASRIGALMAKMITNLNVPLENVELVGHSLGGQIIGYAGSALNGKVGRIISLDPPEMGFKKPALNKTCGQYVQVLHTMKNFSNTKRILGHADFFVNDHLRHQPGCDNLMCDHIRATYIYYTSLFSNNKLVGDDENGKTCQLGTFNSDQNSGMFFLNTTACCPYAL